MSRIGSKLTRTPESTTEVTRATPWTPVCSNDAFACCSRSDSDSEMASRRLVVPLVNPTGDSSRRGRLLGPRLLTIVAIRPYGTPILQKHRYAVETALRFQLRAADPSSCRAIT